jgi:hypothetical protein
MQKAKEKRLRNRIIKKQRETEQREYDRRNPKKREDMMKDYIEFDPIKNLMNELHELEGFQSIDKARELPDSEKLEEIRVADARRYYKD